MKRRLELVECFALAVVYVGLFALDCVRRMIWDDRWGQHQPW